jgi:hypothetical protein
MMPAWLVQIALHRNPPGAALLPEATYSADRSMNHAG